MSDIFSIIPIEVALDDRLTKTHLRVMIALLSFRGKNTNTVWPARETLSKRCGLSVNKISTTTTELCGLGWLKKIGNGGRSRACIYEVTVPDFVQETLPTLGTVPKSETVPTLGTKTLPTLGTKTLPTLGRGIEVTNELKKEVTIILPSTKVPAAKKSKPLSEEETALQELCRNIWSAYKAAFFAKYQTEPVRNATVSSQVKNFAKRLGQEGIFVASWFLGHKQAFYVRGSHSFGLLLKDAESLRTQWATGNAITGRQANEGERIGGRLAESLDGMDLNQPWGKQA